MKYRNEPIRMRTRKFSHANSSVRWIHGCTMRMKHANLPKIFVKFVVTYELTVLYKSLDHFPLSYAHVDVSSCWCTYKDRRWNALGARHFVHNIVYRAYTCIGNHVINNTFVKSRMWINVSHKCNKICCVREQGKWKMIDVL